MSGTIRRTGEASEAVSVAAGVASIGSTDGIVVALEIETTIGREAAHPRPVVIQDLAVTGLITAGTTSGILAIGPGLLCVMADTTRTHTAGEVVAPQGVGLQNLNWTPPGDMAIKFRMFRYSFSVSLISDSLTGFEVTLPHAA
jgi:hypothetical protein